MNETWSSFEEHQLAFDNWRRFSESDALSESIDFSLEEILKEIETLSEADDKDLTSDEEATKLAVNVVVAELAKIPVTKIIDGSINVASRVVGFLMTPIKYIIKSYIAKRVKKSEDYSTVREYMIDWFAKVYATASYYMITKLSASAASAGGAAVGSFVPLPFMAPLFGAIGFAGAVAASASANWGPKVFTGRTLVDYFKKFSTYQKWGEDTFNKYYKAVGWFKKIIDEMEQFEEKKQQERSQSKEQYSKGLESGREKEKIKYFLKQQGPLLQQAIDKADPATAKRLQKLIDYINREQPQITLSQFVDLWDEIEPQSLSYVKKKQSGLPVGTGPTPEGALQEAQIKRFKLLAGVL